MARYRGSKNKIARREGTDLNLKTPGTGAHAVLLRRLKIKPGQHGQKYARKLSDYGRQLREKQKVKRMYGIMEKQFKSYYEKAAKIPGVTGEELLRRLERRLDNVVYRLGFVPTRAAARQLVRHGHVIINDCTMSIPSYQVKKGEIIRLRDTSQKIPTIAKSIAEKTKTIPAWLTAQGIAGKVVSFPNREDIQEDINEQLIVE
ncbi:30S ribosomal protein S4, partial [Candidatus Roizmanbacteria bacterium]|nr:30S ribosomal protein S4 [Candidatus Roizmanbacteria bacterium]